MTEIKLNAEITETLVNKESTTFFLGLLVELTKEELEQVLKKTGQDRSLEIKI